MAETDSKPTGDDGARAAKLSEGATHAAEAATSPSDDKPSATDKRAETHARTSGAAKMSSPDSSSPLPININTNRPPSVNSTHSGASGGNAVRTTTTSRRGGRIRSRSPPTMINRAPGDFQEQAIAGDVRSRSPKNPSSVAAAAAAAAKSLSQNTGGRNTSGWSGPSRQDRRSQDPRYYEGNAYGGPQQAWPGEEGRGGYGQDSRHAQSIHRSSSPYEQQGYGDGHHRSQRRYPDDYHGQYDSRADYEDRRYGYGENTRGRGGDAVPTFDQRRMRHDYFNSPAGMAPMEGNAPVPPSADNAAMPVSYMSPSETSGKRDTEAPSTVKRRGGTSRVIGTPTPIHVPRAPDPPSSQFASPQQSSAASVFRGRPGDAETRNASTENIEDETPQRLLLSLRTPTTSFEENKSSSRAGPLSPEGPPKIHNAHQQRGDQPLIFEVNSSC